MRMVSLKTSMISCKNSMCSCPSTRTTVCTSQVTKLTSLNYWSIQYNFNSEGESYAGHYIPAISNHIWEKNQEDDDDYKIPLKGLAIGNGLTNTEIQYTTYPEMAFDGGKLILFCSYSLRSVRL